MENTEMQYNQPQMHEVYMKRQVLCRSGRPQLAPFRSLLYVDLYAVEIVVTVGLY